MKTKYIYPCIMALAIATGCVKEQGDEAYTISRKVTDKGDDYTPFTIVSDVDGYMYGKASMDTLVSNSFKSMIGSNNKLGLDCYIVVSSNYSELDLSRNAVKGAGYVISHTNNRPVLEGDDCDKFLSKYVKYDEGDSTETEISFKGECHELDVNKSYYVRSYVITTQGDTLYNPRVLSLKTNKPHDVWIQRGNSPFTGRYEAFSCDVDGTRYIYGGKNGATYFNDMWSYDTDGDTWTQLATYDDPNSRFQNTYKRANGAMFAYNKGDGDILLFIAGGECGKNLKTGTSTASEGSEDGVIKTVMFYSTLHDRYCEAQDHPNYSTMVPAYINGKMLYDTTFAEDGSIISTTPMMVSAGRDYVGNLPEPLCGCVGFSMKTSGGVYYYIGFGKTDKNEGASGISSLVYRYDIDKDIKDYQNPVNDNYAWTESGSSSNANGSGEGLYQPVCVVCDSRTVVGTGQSSKGGCSKSFYTIAVDATGEISLKSMTGPGDGFVGRANAAGFFFEYEDDDESDEEGGETHQRFYIGTGRDCEETAAPTAVSHLLKDFWSYDFNTGTWQQQADCSNIGREGAVGFTVYRTDDFEQDDTQKYPRGIFSLGYGAVFSDAYLENPDGVEVNATYMKDNWEYLP